MGFPPAEVAAGVRDLLATLGSTVEEERREDTWIFRAGEITLTVGPLPKDRPTLALFHPRTLLVVAGSGPLADALRQAVRTRFLRVMG